MAWGRRALAERPQTVLAHDLRHPADDFEFRTEHTYLVAFSVNALTREQGEALLTSMLPKPSDDPTGTLDSWWVAEDDRHDGSDCDSAVFVPYNPTREA